MQCTSAFTQSVHETWSIQPLFYPCNFVMSAPVTAASIAAKPKEDLVMYVKELTNPAQREAALVELSKKRLVWPAGLLRDCYSSKLRSLRPFCSQGRIS